jgi:hypothetical protein
MLLSFDGVFVSEFLVAGGRLSGFFFNNFRKNIRRKVKQRAAF